MVQGGALVGARGVQAVVRNPWGQWVVQWVDRHDRQSGVDATDGWISCWSHLWCHVQWCGTDPGGVTKLVWLGWPAMWVSSETDQSQCRSSWRWFAFQTGGRGCRVPGSLQLVSTSYWMCRKWRRRQASSN